jgi:hypothetical protein
VNVNVKITLTDEQRAALHQKFYGKKGLISRRDVSAICQAAITDMLLGRNVVQESIDFEPEQVTEFCSDDCCKANALLLNRINVLQHSLDTGRSK